MIIQVLWYCKIDVIIDAKLDDAELDTYKLKPMSELLSRWESIKKHKHGKHCHDQQIFSAVCSFSGKMIGEGSPSHDISIESSHGQ